MKLKEVENRLRDSGLEVFTSREFRRISGGTAASAKMRLVRYVQKGYIHKLKDNRGLYALADVTLHPWKVANRLLRPSYVSLETALSYYGVLPESVYAVTSVTPKTTRTFHAQGIVYTYQKIKQEFSF